jgi:hypothetical protein
MSKALLLGLVVLAATGCTIGSRTAMRDGNYGGHGSPASTSEDLRRCETDGGWFDHAASVCDHVGVGGD